MAAVNDDDPTVLTYGRPVREWAYAAGFWFWVHYIRRVDPPSRTFVLWLGPIKLRRRWPR